MYLHEVVKEGHTMTMTLADAIAEVKRGEPLELLNTQTWAAYEVIITAVASGDLIPRTDADLAVALAYQRAGDAYADGTGTQWDYFGAAYDAILSLAPADALAEVEKLRAEIAELKSCRD